MEQHNVYHHHHYTYPFAPGPPQNVLQNVKPVNQEPDGHDNEHSAGEEGDEEDKEDEEDEEENQYHHHYNYPLPPLVLRLHRGHQLQPRWDKQAQTLSHCRLNALALWNDEPLNQEVVGRDVDKTTAEEEEEHSENGDIEDQ
ncbi:hypothetical protein FMUND_6453 [Fusarium mundagurra]|uniref:Uncharacterized protein n=1 Tax=Fusarium mundagurra TaxID=1567541 RepID=A0A8H5YP52_9HYPO|nr:hypothetical protein FMUND_6453 [Fusarium mundagurra]